MIFTAAMSAMMPKRRYARRAQKLDSLPAEVKERVREMSSDGRTIEEICGLLGSLGIGASQATVSRYLRTEEMRESSGELAASAEEFAKAEKGEVFRVGTLEALRQKMYEHALKSENGAEALGMYRAALAEEEKLRRMEMDRERLELQREGLLLQKQRLQLEAARGNVKLLLEAARILKDEGLGDGAKVAQLRDRLKGVLEVEAEVVGGGVEKKVAALGPVIDD